MKCLSLIISYLSDNKLVCLPQETFCPYLIAMLSFYKYVEGWMASSGYCHFLLIASVLFSFVVAKTTLWSGFRSLKTANWPTLWALLNWWGSPPITLSDTWFMRKYGMSKSIYAGYQIPSIKRYHIRSWGSASHYFMIMESHCLLQPCDSLGYVWRTSWTILPTSHPGLVDGHPSTLQPRKCVGLGGGGHISLYRLFFSASLTHYAAMIVSSTFCSLKRWWTILRVIQPALLPSSSSTTWVTYIFRQAW